MNIIKVLRNTRDAALRCNVPLQSRTMSIGKPLCDSTTNDTEPPIPKYFLNPDEPITVKKARLMYQSRKRGMLENDLLLGTFASKYLEGFNKSQLQQYDFLINMPSNDWDIYYWVTGVKETPAEFQTEVMDLLKEHCKNTNRDKRIRQPDLHPV